MNEDLQDFFFLIFSSSIVINCPFGLVEKVDIGSTWKEVDGGLI